MTWDFAEANPFSSSGGNFIQNLSFVSKVLLKLVTGPPGTASQADAAARGEAGEEQVLVSTDPPYYDNIGYADLSDFFYVWMRRTLRHVFPSIFGTVLVPKAAELVATPYRHGGREAADAFFLQGMTEALGSIRRRSVRDSPVTVYYAFKQSETRKEGTSNTGWETFLAAVLEARFVVTGTWPVRTERSARSVGIGTNALASSILLVCRSRAQSATVISRAEFRRKLRAELPDALRKLQHGHVAPVDVAQASIGPGMAVFSRYAGVLEADGARMTIRAALRLIHEIIDEHQGEQEGDYDAWTRFAVTWFETNGFDEGSYGQAEVLATARAVSVAGVEHAGIARAVAGKVRLLTRPELPPEWDPESDDRLTVWEGTQHLIKRLDENGERAAAALMKQLGETAEQARHLAYRLYTICERKGWAEEGRAYNGLVITWPELEKLAREQLL